MRSQTTGRSRSSDENPGFGYADMVMGELGYQRPYAFTCFNRGISGDRVVDLYARIRKDMILLRPDYMSILIGVNDVWHDLMFGNGVAVDKFEMVYGLIIEELLHDLPNLKLMLLEPFVLPGSATEATEAVPYRWEYFQKELGLRQAAVRRVAEKYGLIFVPLQEKFNALNANAPAGYWLRDGVHPTPAGHAMIAEAWLEGFDKLKSV
jgi:lysophospholipase L1-like esterase